MCLIVALICRIYAGVPLIPNSYRYDSKSGLWGLDGQGLSGFTSSQLCFQGTLPENCSMSGDLENASKVLLNGRALPESDIAYLQALGVQLSSGMWNYFYFAHNYH